MKTIKIKMPLVSQCNVSGCSYNKDNNCRAKAITIGDFDNPGCDTYLDSIKPKNIPKSSAGVGACKVNICKYNVDFECSADTIKVGIKGAQSKCLTFKS